MMYGIPAALLSSMERAPWGWALLVIISIALIRAWPALAKLSIEARQQLRTEKRADLTDCKVRLDMVEKRLRTVEAQSHSFELKLLGALSAYRILDVAHEAACPGSNEAAQARAVLQAAFAVGELPADIIELLAKIPNKGVSA